MIYITRKQDIELDVTSSEKVIIPFLIGRPECKGITFSQYFRSKNRRYRAIRSIYDCM